MRGRDLFFRIETRRQRRMAIEIERKYIIEKASVLELSQKLTELNALFSYETFEENYLYRGGVLDGRAAVLRLRKTNERSTLTYKEKVSSENDFKHQIELETDVSNVAATESIIAKLGYTLSIIYEKRRKAWRLGNAEVVLDELPFGLYMEIEGRVEDIVAAEKMLGADRFEIEATGYPGLTLKHGHLIDGIIESRFAGTN